MPDTFKEKREKTGTKVMSQLEMDAQLIREKTARLRELRLAQEAANGGAAARAPVRGSAPAAKKKKTRKSGEKGPSLSDWLDTQQNQGRRG
jgi:hypothetical protein